MNALCVLGADNVLLVSPNTVEVIETFRFSAEDVETEVLHGERGNLLRSNTPLISERECYHICAQAFRAASAVRAV